MPAQPSVVRDRPVVVGQPSPEAIAVYPLPQHGQYEYAIVNHHRGIIDPAARRIVRVID